MSDPGPSFRRMGPRGGGRAACGPERGGPCRGAPPQARPAPRSGALSQ